MTDAYLLGLLSARKGEVGQALDDRFKGTSGGQNSTQTTEQKKRMINNDISDDQPEDAGISSKQDAEQQGRLPLGGEIKKVIPTKSSDAASKVAEDNKSSASADTSEKLLLS